MTPVYSCLHMRGKDGAVVGPFVNSIISNIAARVLYSRINDIIGPVVIEASHHCYFRRKVDQ